MLNKLRTILVLNTSAEDTDSEDDLKVSETSTKAESKTKGTMLPVIIGIVLLAVVTLIAGLFYFLKRKKSR
jgi:cobalamin biosynthesis Mg chelatase CobN